MSTRVVTQTRPLRRDAAANRERLLATAAGVFHEHGLSACLDDVARGAGVGVGTLYRHFPRREDLLAALLAEQLETCRDLAQQALQLPDGGGLASYVRAVSELQATARGCALQLWSAPGIDVDRTAVHALVDALLDDARRHGTCRDDVTVADVAAILAALRGVRESAPDADWRRHLELCLSGLRPPE